MDRSGSLLTPGAAGGGLLAALSTRVAEVADPSTDASARLSMVITGLLVLAALILIATVIFWRMTRPERTPKAPRRGQGTPPVEDAGQAASGPGPVAR